MNEGLVKSLKNILKEQLALFEKLLELANRKRKLLLEKFSSDLQIIVAEEEKIIVALSNLENERKAIFAEISGNSELKLEQLLDHIKSADLKSDLWIIANKMKDIATKIRTINEENQKLLQQALELTQYTIQLISKIPASSIYSHTGTKSTTKLPSIFDTKA